MITISLVLIKGLLPSEKVDFNAYTIPDRQYKQHNITFKTKDYNVEGLIANSKSVHASHKSNRLFINTAKKDLNHHYTINLMTEMYRAAGDVDVSSINVNHKNSYQRNDEQLFSVQQVNFSNGATLNNRNIISKKPFSEFLVQKAPPTGIDLEGMDDPGVPLDKECLILSILGILMIFVKCFNI